jgi:hypothetical protein
MQVDSKVGRMAEEKIIIDERLETYHKNPDLGSPWEGIYKRILSGNEILL